MRLFVGVPVPEPLIGPLLAVQEAVPLGRAVPEENLHVTLAFLGDVDVEAAAELHEALDGRRLPRPVLTLEGLASYGGGRTKLLAAELRATPELRDLRETVVRAVRQAGVVLERTRFRPHVTLVRFGSGLPPHRQPELDRALAHVGQPAGEAPAERIVLWQSHLGEGGALYEEMAAYPLV